MLDDLNRRRWGQFDHLAGIVDAATAQSIAAVGAALQRMLHPLRRRGTLASTVMLGGPFLARRAQPGRLRTIGRAARRWITVRVFKLSDALERRRKVSLELSYEGTQLVHFGPQSHILFLKRHAPSIADVRLA